MLRLRQLDERWQLSEHRALHYYAIWMRCLSPASFRAVGAGYMEIGCMHVAVVPVGVAHQHVHLQLCQGLKQSPAVHRRDVPPHSFEDQILLILPVHDVLSRLMLALLTSLFLYFLFSFCTGYSARSNV